MDHHFLPDALDEANYRARRATTALAQGLGIVALLRQVMAARGDARPVPGLDHWQQTLDATSAEVCRAADELLLLRGDVDRAEVARLVAAASQPMYEAETALRFLAQLSLGISSGYGAGEDVARLERTASLVLAFDAGFGGGILTDGYRSSARSLEELEIELAGFLCRMNLEHGAALVIRSPQGQVTVRTDEVGDLSAAVAAPEVADLPLEVLGWSEAGTAAWPSPPVIALPARQVASTLAHLVGDDLAGIEFSVHFNDHATAPLGDHDLSG